MNRQRRSSLSYLACCAALIWRADCFCVTRIQAMPSISAVAMAQFEVSCWSFASGDQSQSHTRKRDVLSNDGDQGLGIGIRDDRCVHRTASHSAPTDRHFSCCAPPATALTYPAQIALIDFNLAGTEENVLA